MPKGRKSSGKGGDSCVFPFHYVLQGTLVSGVSRFSLGPNSSTSPRGLVEADTWAHFRVRSFSFRLLPTAHAAASNDQAVGFLGGIEDTLPGSIANVVELLPSSYLAGRQVVPSDWSRPSKQELAGPFPWYKTIPGTADATEESPGTVAIVGTGSEEFALEMRGIFEFKTAVATANTPLALAARNKLREERVRAAMLNERELLLKILATPAIPSQPKGGTAQP